jgi:hypothetical protein
MIKESEIFSKYDDACKVWVFSCSRKLEPEEEENLLSSINQFFTGWKRHGKKVQSACEILYHQFIIIISNEAVVEASGCSQDALLHFMAEPLKIDGMNYLAPNTISYENENGDVQFLTRNEFVKNIQRKRIFNEETPVFDTTLFKIIDFKADNFKLKLKDCWHHKLFETYN